MGGVKLYLFGPPRLEQKGEPLEIPRRKADALLAYLAVTRQPHSRETLAALLWAEYDSSQGRADLSRMLSVLKKALGSEWVEADRETITLDPDFDLWVDVIHFQALLTECEAHGHLATEVCPNCLSPLTEAVELYQADFMAGFTLPDAPKFDEWQFFQTESLRQQLASALERLAHEYSNRQEYELAISYARRWLTLDPIQEVAHRQLMELYAQSGQRAAAVRQYQECIRILDDELGIEPQPETRALYERIQRGPAAQTAASGQTSRSAAHDLPRFLTQKSAPLETEKTEFVARARELSHLNEHLAAALRGQGRVVFINGEAGRGKTSLMREFARRAQATHETLMVASGNCNAFTGAGDPYLPFRDVMGMLCGDVETRWAAGAITREHARRLWELAPLAAQTLVEEGPDLIDVFVSTALLIKRVEALSTDQREELFSSRQRAPGGKGAVAPGEQHQLFEQYNQVVHKLAAHHPLLLLLDDLQWADNASINLLFHLGRRLPGAQILIVGAYRLSEVALGRPFAGAEEIQQHPLNMVITELKRQFGDIQLDLGRFTATEGQTFVDALLDTKPNRLGEKFRQALFERTKGHPLFTIELLRDMQEQGALVQDEEGFWIEGQEINWPELPARAEAVIEGRIGRLDDELRDILTVASVEGEEFTAQVIARVQNMEVWPLLRQLSQELEKRHRLVREHEEIEIGTQRLTRYHFGHVLFQQYLYNHLSLAERRMLHGQIAQVLEEIYTRHTEVITPQLAHHYFQAGEGAKAITYARQAAQRAEAMYAYNEAAQHLHTALALIEPGQQVEMRMVILEQLADVYALLGERPRSIQLYQNALDLWHGLEEVDKMIAVRLHRKIGEMVVFMTWFADRQRFEATAQASFEAGLKLAQDESPHPETVRLLTILSYDAWLTRVAADWNTAEQYAKEAVALAEQLDAPVELSGALDALATVYGARGLLRERVTVSLRRLELSHDPHFSNAREHAKILQQTGFALTQVGEYTEAMPYLLEAETVSREVQALDQQFRALRWQAYCWFRLDRWNKVLEIDEKWRALEQHYPNFAERVGPTCFLISLSASVYALRGDSEQGEALHNEAVATMVANDGPAEGWERDNRY